MLAPILNLVLIERRQRSEAGLRKVVVQAEGHGCTLAGIPETLAGYGVRRPRTGDAVGTPIPF
jgi:hypothetical protein